MKTLGEHIRELREKKDISVRELAKVLKVSAPFLSDVELGRRHPSNEVLQSIASSLGTTLEDLQRYDSRPPIEALKKIAVHDPAMGFALRRVVDEGIKSEDLLEFLNRQSRKKKP